MSSPTTSFRPQPGRRPSISSRLSFAMSHAESGEDISAAVPAQAQIAEEIAEIKRYEDFTTIDWVQDAAREQARRKSKQRRAAGLYGQGQTNWRHRVSQSYDAAQGWIVVTIIGAAIGLNAAFLNIVTEWLSDIKMGYCTTAFYLNENFCCWGEDNGTGRSVQRILRTWPDANLPQAVLNGTDGLASRRSITLYTWHLAYVECPFSCSLYVTD